MGVNTHAIHDSGVDLKAVAFLYFEEEVERGDSRWGDVRRGVRCGRGEVEVNVKVKGEGDSRCDSASIFPGISFSSSQVYFLVRFCVDFKRTLHGFSIDLTWILNRF